MTLCRFLQPRSFLSLFVALLLPALSGVAHGAQQPGMAQPSAKTTSPEKSKTDRGTWQINVSKRLPQTFSIKANDALVAEIANELGKRLKVPVVLSPLMQKQRVKLDFSALTLDAALLMLAPKPYIDYEAGGEELTQPKVLAIYLCALNERPPDASIALQNRSEAMVVEGSTEEGTDEAESGKGAEEQPLIVSFINNQLSVKARKQPLSVVLYKIASEVGIPFEMHFETNEIIDAEFTGYSLEQAMRSLSSSVRYYFRADLQNFEIQPLRIA